MSSNDNNPFGLSDEQLLSYEENGMIFYNGKGVTGDWVDLSTLPGYGTKPASEVLQDYIESKKQ